MTRMRIGFLVGLLIAGVVISYPALADVTGSFGTHISITPQTTTTEISLLDFDIENNLTATLSLAGLSVTFHTHFGIAGLEDVIVTSSVSLRPQELLPFSPSPLSTDIQAMVVFGRFASGAVVPFYDELHFIKKVVKLSMSLLGIKLTNTGQFEDTDAFVSLTPAHAFGDVISISGTTPQGVSLTATTGICMQEIINSIKKHVSLSLYSVNPDCATTPKPDILFDFEKIQISNVPVAPSVLANTVITCIKINKCSLVTTFRVSGGPVPIQVSLTFSDLLSLSFDGGSISLSSGQGTLQLSITPTGTIGLASVSMNAVVLGSDGVRATLAINLNISPGIGVTGATITLNVASTLLLFSATATFSGTPAVFSDLLFSLTVPGQLLELRTSAKFTPTGLVKADLDLTIKF